MISADEAKAARAETMPPSPKAPASVSRKDYAMDAITVTSASCWLRTCSSAAA